MNKRTARIALFAAMLAFFVVTLGAYTRLTNAGLGCPDWPGCYGHLLMGHTKALAKVDDNVQFTKALTEMVHRYFAGTLGLIILGFAITAIVSRVKGKPFPFSLPLVLVCLVLFQAALGMWTVTLKLLPVVVMMHLLGGLAILSCLWWLYLTLSEKQGEPSLKEFKPIVIFGLLICIIQIAMGGWVSSNYAGISCVGFPYCNGELIPRLDFSQAFQLSPIGHNYQGGLLDVTSRITIQYVHRIGAMITALYVGLLSIFLLRRGDSNTKRVAAITLMVLATQFSLGVINVVYLLPLKAAVLHNAVAALLLLCMLTMTHKAFAKGA